MTASSEASAGRLRLPRLHLVTDPSVLERSDFERVAASLLAAGGPRVALHLRGPGMSGRALWELAARCAGFAAESGAWLIVNDRLDVALACRAAGVQLGHRSFSVSAARALLGPAVAIGASVHDAETARRTVREGADYLLAGTLYQSRSHPDQPGSGVAWLADIRALGMPFIGIGGITPDRVAPVREAGAHGVAVIRGVWHADDPVVALEHYLVKLEG